MTYPDDPAGLSATGLNTEGVFQKEGKEADDVRTRLAGIAMEWYRKCQSARVPQERQWSLNLAFYNGNQHVQIRQLTNGAFDLYTPKAPYYRVRIVINRIRQVVRKEISRLTAQKPNAFVVPSSSEDADIFAAQAGEQIWDSLWRRLHFNKTLRDCVFWQAVCGNGFLKSWWDPTKQDPGSDLPGDICIEAISPYYIFVPDLMLTDIEEQPYVIQAQVRNKSWVRKMYGIEADDSKLEEVDEALLNTQNVNRNDSKDDQCIILEVWVKPGFLPELPNGGMFIVAAEKVVQGIDHWPYEHGQFPFTKIDGMMSGKFYNASVIEDLIPIQKELNRTRAQLIEAKNRAAKPQLVAEEGTVDAKKITTEPGQVIFYKLGFQPPQPLPLQNIPSYVSEEIDRLYTDISDLSGIHDVSNGSTPPGVTAATAISFLQEQDESLIAPHYSSIEEAVEKVAGQSLMYVQMYWDEARTVKTVGIDGTFDVQTFKGSDLRGNTDIRSESGSALPTSRAAKQALLMDLMKMGFIPPDDGLEMMEIGGINKIYERIKIDKRQAQRENLKMRSVTQQDIDAHNQQWQEQQMAAMQQMQPQQPVDPLNPIQQPANPLQNPDPTVDVDTQMLNLVPPPLVAVHTWDNHEVHIQVHNDYRKSQNFESAPPEVKALFEEHVRQHQAAIAGQMTHPMTGMDPSDPNAPDPEMEQDAADQQMQDDGSGETGPVPMPETSSDVPADGGTVQ